MITTKNVFRTIPVTVEHKKKVTVYIMDGEEFDSLEELKDEFPSRQGWALSRALRIVNNKIGERRCKHPELQSAGSLISGMDADDFQAISEVQQKWANLKNEVESL